MYRREQLKNLPSGHDGDGYITISGRTVPAFLISALTIDTEQIKGTKRFLKERVEQNAVRGVRIVGTVSYYHRTSEFMKAIEAYKEGADFPEITIQGYAEVTGSGRCEILASGVILNKVGLIGLDDNSDDPTVIQSDLTADDFTILSSFVEGGTTQRVTGTNITPNITRRTV
ncbi:MAG: phage tail tube protein [Oscillospiraceae bacterium]|jgi:hypothetical protein|nr:phage tail tube protein [Oscillospiraceae bacterium]